MKAVILAGGEGSRLRPISSDKPKPMVRMFDKPILEYSIELLKKHGFDDITATLQMLPHKITDHFGDGKSFGVTLHYSVESTPLGTAGGVKSCRDNLGDEPFVVLSGDSVTDIDLKSCLDFHKKNGADATIVLSKQSKLLDYGLVMIDDAGLITRFIEKPTWGQVFSDTVNTGIYILSPRVLDMIPDNTFFDFAKDLFPQMLKNGMNLFGVVADGYWCDMGDPIAFMNVVCDGLDGAVELALPSQSMPSAGVMVQQPCYIGENVRFGKGCKIGPYAVIGAGSSVGDHATVEFSVVDGAQIGAMNTLEGAYVGKGCILGTGAALREGAVLGEGVIVGQHAEVCHSARVWPKKEIEADSRVEGSVASGQLRKGAVFEDSSIYGHTHIDITPDFCLRLGIAAVTTHGAEIALAWHGGDAARLTALALETGICAAGGRPVLTDSQSQSCSAFVAGLYHFPLTIFVRQRNDSVSMSFFDADGLEISRDSQRKIESLMARGEVNFADSRQIGHSRPLAGAGEAYISSAAAPPEWFTGKNGRGTLAVCVEGTDVASVSLRSGLEAIGCRVRRENGVPVFIADENSKQLTVIDEDGKTLFNGRLLGILLWLEAQHGLKNVALPYTAPAVLDEIAQKSGLSVLRLGRDGKIARELYARQQFTRDAVFAACRLAYGLIETGLSMAKLAQKVPAFYESSIDVGIMNDRGAIMRALAASHRDAELIEGFRTKIGGGWVHVSPLAGLRALRITAEGYSEEIAAEICDMFSKQTKKMDRQDNSSVL